MSRKTKRGFLIGGAFVVAIAAVGLTLTALSNAVAYFYTPADLAQADALPSGPIRLGGLVAAGSIAHGDNATVSFVIEDEISTVPVTYQGILPDLFREGQGVVVQGRVNADGSVAASEVLAKHDENYMPAEVAEALKEQGRWREGANN